MKKVWEIIDRELVMMLGKVFWKIIQSGDRRETIWQKKITGKSGNGREAASGEVCLNRGRFNSLRVRANFRNRRFDVGSRRYGSERRWSDDSYGMEKCWNKD